MIINQTKLVTSMLCTCMLQRFLQNPVPPVTLYVMDIDCTGLSGCTHNLHHSYIASVDNKTDRSKHHQFLESSKGVFFCANSHCVQSSKSSVGLRGCWRQWRSQSAADARAQHGHTMFASSLVPSPYPAFSCLQYGKCRSNYKEVWGMLP